ncbi:MAG: hypothetical protein ACNA8W_10010 [Bradymonadaceae bacterium]
MKNRTLKKSILVATTAFLAMQMACIPAEDSRTAEFRAGLVGESDIRMTLGAGASGQRGQALNGEPALMAAITADVVTGTNSFLLGHLTMMRFIVDLPPTVIEDDLHVWEGTHQGTFMRVTVERSDALAGTKFDYRMEGRPASASDDELLTYFDGEVVRVETETGPTDNGWGLIRYYFDNLSTIEEHKDVAGTGRITFRRAGNVHQIRVHLDEIKTPEDPNFPEAAIFDYTLLPDLAGGLRFFARADVKKDGSPLEDVAIFSAWRADLSGAAVGLVTGGSLDADYWHMVECWDTMLHKNYWFLGTNLGQLEDGDRAGCQRDPDTMDVPEFDEESVSQDPVLPEAHADEA